MDKELVIKFWHRTYGAHVRFDDVRLKMLLNNVIYPDKKSNICSFGAWNNSIDFIEWGHFELGHDSAIAML